MVINERYLDKSSHSFKEYLKDIKKIPLLTADEELKLANLSLSGDEKAREKLITGNLRFVITVANQYQTKGIKIEDVVNEGNYGLIEAVNRYDPTKGARLLSYAVHYINRRILDYLKENQDIYDIPKGKVTKIFKMKRLMTNLENELGREVYPEDLYGEMDCSDNEVDDVYSLLNFRSVSTSQQMGGDDENFTLEDTLDSESYDDTLRTDELNFNIDLISKMVNKLPHRLQILMTECYGLGGSKALGRKAHGIKHGITVARVDQLHKTAIRMLRRIARGEDTNYEMSAPSANEVIERARLNREKIKLNREKLNRNKPPKVIEPIIEDISIGETIMSLFRKIF